ncbi:TetR/AcrR family transcriptional regulator [Sphaerisporangium sp. NBC_01403]|uniref:TetR/AcrR family transcriptional regulator n=1 Tax=Sphaerisporangium sp. NBC_01403 TaxID=2903599 RepID=UPI003254D0EA
MGMDEVAPRRRLRADARRNRERLLAEAAAVFSERGTEASLEDIARRAGVAIGTLYGHFPTRQALLEALMCERMRSLSDTGRELLDHASPKEALTIWARAAVAHTTVYRGLATSLMQGMEDEDSALHAACQAVTAAGAGLLARAQESGLLRDDATAFDLFTLVNAVAWAGEQTSPQQGERLLRFVMDGLRPVAEE